MGDRLTLGQIVLLITYAAGMAGGQLLFKVAAARLSGPAPFLERLLGLLTNTAFLLAVGLYGVLTVLWVWLLSFTPLSRAYPFVALAIVLTPIAGAMIFGEALHLRLVIGLAVILVGLWLVSG